MQPTQFTHSTPTDKEQASTPPAVPLNATPSTNPFTDVDAPTASSAHEPTFGTAFETVDSENEDDAPPFHPGLFSFQSDDTRLLLPFIADSKSLATHWYKAADFPNACVFCWGKEKCPLCRGLQQAKTDVIVPVIDLGPHLPGYLKMQKTRTGGAGSARSKDGGGQSLFSQIAQFQKNLHPPASTGLRISKNRMGMFTAIAVPLEPSDLPPQALIDRFTTHLAQSPADIFGAFVRFDQPADLIQVPSIQRLILQAERR